MNNTLNKLNKPFTAPLLLSLTALSLLASGTLSNSLTAPQRNNALLTNAVANGGGNPDITTKSRKNAKDSAEMILIPAGEFTMGSTEAEIDALTKQYAADEHYKAQGPQHKVTLDGYYIYRTPVTVAQYLTFCAETGQPLPPAPDFNPNWSLRNHPIVNITYEDALAYCKWAGGDHPGSVRLPTEAEWEKAASWDEAKKQKRRFPWGDQFDRSKLRCSTRKGLDAGGTAPVGSFPGGASSYGVLDMAGNVWQWCSDWYDENYYQASPKSNPAGPASGSVRARRGGTWGYNLDDRFRSAYRHGIAPDTMRIGAGFRCVVSANSP